jgi:ABC 3 transport family
VGLYLSYYLDISSGPAVVMVSTAFFILSFLFSPRQGLLTHFLHNSQDEASVSGRLAEEVYKQ